MDTDTIVAKTYTSLIITGAIIICLTIGTSSVASVSGTIVGYSFIAVGFLILSGVSMSKMRENASLMSFLYTIGPFLLIIASIFYVIYLLSFYFNKITSGNVSNGYYSFSKIVLVLIVSQLIVFYYGTQEKTFKMSHSLSKIYGMLLYLIGLLAIISIYSLGTILAYFSTDG